jgi:hypothetical protein
MMRFVPQTLMAMQCGQKTNRYRFEPFLDGFFAALRALIHSLQALVHLDVRPYNMTRLALNMSHPRQ